MPKKSNSEQNAQAFIQAARRQIIHSAIFAVAALGVIVFACYAWFASNHSVSGTIGSIQMLAAAPPLPQEAGAADAVRLYDPTRENGIPEHPQTLRYAENINNSSAEDGQSKAEAI